MQKYKVRSVTRGVEVDQSHLGEAPKDEAFKLTMTEEGKKSNDKKREEYRRRRKPSPTD
jgi:hypothetical protein